MRLFLASLDFITLKVTKSYGVEQGKEGGLLGVGGYPFCGAFLATYGGAAS